MNQIEYLRQLKHHLSPLGRDERNRVIEYYSELIGDKIESGITEQEVLTQLGTPYELAEKILSESPEYGKKPKHSNNGKLSVGRIVGFSVLIPFVLVALAVLYVLALSFVIAAISCLLGGITYFVGSFFVLINNFATGLYQLGVSLFIASIGVFVAFGVWKFIFLCVKVTCNIFKAYKRTYVKEAVEI